MRLIALLAAASTLLSACGTIDQAHWALIEHPKKTVRYPANVGKAVGMIAGIPIGIVLAIPSMIVANLVSDDDEVKAWSGLIPYVACYDVGTLAFGGIPWSIFGWWGVPKSESKAVVNTKARWPMGTYVETPTGSMVVGDSSSKTGEFSEKDK